MKKNEKIFLAIIVVLIAGVYLVMNLMQEEKQYIVVKHFNDVILTIDSSEDGFYVVEGNVGEVHIEVKDKQFRVVEVDCPDKLCQKQGWQNMIDGQPVVCVPNQIIIEKSI